MAISPTPSPDQDLIVSSPSPVEPNSPWATTTVPKTCGPIAFVGGNEWGEGATYDRTLLEWSGSDKVTVLPTAAAFEHPQKAVDTASNWFSALGASVEGLMVLNRSDAFEERFIDAISKSRFIYLGGGSPLHLRSIFRDSPVYDAIIKAWHGGAVLAGSSAGAMVLGNPMVDPRGGAFTVGLGLVNNFSVIPHFDTGNPERIARSFALAPPKIVVAGIPERTALMRDPQGIWTYGGVGVVSTFLEGKPCDFSLLDGLVVSE